MKRFSKKTIILAIIFTLITSNLIGLAIANEKKDKVDMNTEKQEEMAMSGEMPADMPAMDLQLEGAISVTGVVYGEQEEKIERIKLKSHENRKNRLRQVDQYNYSKKDIEELLLSGASVEDIYASDEIGNEWLVDPKELVKMKKENNKNWDDIETQVKNEKEEKLKDLIKKHPQLDNKLAKKTMNAAEKLELVQLVDEVGEEIFSQVVEAYESEGLEGLRKTKENQKKIDDSNAVIDVGDEMDSNEEELVEELIDGTIDDAIDSSVKYDSTVQEVQ